MLRTKEENKKKSKDNQRDQIGKRTFYQRFPILINLLLMSLITIIIVLLIMFGLDRYTHHGESVMVPSIVGMQLEKGVEELEKVHLLYEVVDSVYNEDGVPGAIHDVVPVDGSKVKRERLIFLTINAISKPQIVLPDVKDMSMRQAKATLEGIGLNSILVKYVPGEYDNLTQSITDTNGIELTAGRRIDYDTSVVLVVSSNSINLPLDSIFGDIILSSDSTFSDSIFNKNPEKLSEKESWW